MLWKGSYKREIGSLFVLQVDESMDINYWLFFMSGNLTINSVDPGSEWK
jgi:hypothetical protein